jgi:hypothetical protein
VRLPSSVRRTESVSMEGIVEVSDSGALDWSFRSYLPQGNAMGACGAGQCGSFTPSSGTGNDGSASMVVSGGIHTYTINTEYQAPDLVGTQYLQFKATNSAGVGAQTKFTISVNEQIADAGMGIVIAPSILDFVVERVQDNASCPQLDCLRMQATVADEKAFSELSAAWGYDAGGRTFSEPTLTVDAQDANRGIVEVLMSSYQDSDNGTITLTITDAGGIQSTISFELVTSAYPIEQVCYTDLGDCGNDGGTDIPTEGLVAYYPFNGSANDESGNENHGVVSGASLTTDRFDRTNKAYLFNGLKDYIQIKNSDSFIFGKNFSVSVWVKPKSIGTYGRIFNKWASSQEDFFIGISSSNHLKSYLFGLVRPSLESNSLATIDSWNHIVVTYDGSTSKLYLDGVLSSSASNSNFISRSNGDLFIGHNPSRESEISNSAFNGVIDDLMIYDRPLTLNEIDQLYKNQNNDATPAPQNNGQVSQIIGDIANYSFNGDTNDSSGNNRNLTNFGASFSTDRHGNQNQSFLFDNDYMILEDGISESLRAISFWSYSTSNSAEQMYFYVDTSRELYNSFGSNYYFSFPRSCIRTNRPAPTINKWHSIIVNLTGSEFQLYIDGVLSQSSACSATVDLNNEKYYIGSKNGSGYFVKGKIDDFKIF